MAYEGNWIESSKIAAESVSKIWAFLQRYERCLLQRLNGNEQGLKLESFDWHELQTHHQNSLEQYTKGIGNCANAVAPEVSSWSSKISSRLNESRYRDPLKNNPFILKMDATRDIKLYIYHWAASGISSTFFVHTAGSISKLRLLCLDILEHPHSLYVTLGHSQSQTIRECNSFL